jgi:mitochondrial fission process protein 1
MSIEKEKDLWRDTPIRYLGYANECGEAFRPLKTRFVRPSYAVAFGYVLGDTGSKTLKSKEAKNEDTEVAKTALDCFVWQTLASVMIPGLVINRVTSTSAQIMNTNVKLLSSLPSPLKRFGPTMIGLMTIPLIIHPIDNGVTWFMDNTVRKWW